MITLKKQSIINLVRYHVEKNEEAFVGEVANIAKEFDSIGDETVAQYLMELVSNSNFYVPQASYKNLRYLSKVEYSSKPLLLPDVIEEDIIGITKAISGKSSLSKFLFFGAPGSGKTESAYQIARILNRDLLSVRLEQLVDSRLGETAKNITALFDEIKHLPYSSVIILFDEIDAIVLDRINNNDLREMGRVTSSFIRGLDDLPDKIVIIATTNLFDSFDKALLRRFDALISFDRYSKEDLIEIADSILSAHLKQATNVRQDIRLFNKILRGLKSIPFPGDLKQIIKTAIAFSDESNEYDYLRRIYISLHDNIGVIDIQKLNDEGFTTREIEILTKVPRSSVSRKLRGSK